MLQRYAFKTVLQDITTFKSPKRGFKDQVSYIK